MKRWIQALLIAMALAVFGCGGGGGGGGLSGGISVFFTDDLSASYDAVWVKVFKVELQSASGFRTIFDDSAGRVYNLRSLNDGSPRFAFLGKDKIPEGTYTGVRITLDKNVTLFPTGSATGLQRTFDDGYNDPASPTTRSRLLISFAGKALGTGSDDLVCDFKLNTWSENGTKVQNCSVEDGPHGGLDDGNRHDPDDFKGTVGNLAGVAPNFTFTLTGEHDKKISVMTDSTTTIFNANGSPNPTLANGKRVKVRGKYSPADSMVFATSIKIGSNDDGGEAPQGVRGAPTKANADQGTFDVVLGHADGFIPTEGSVHVHLADAVKIFSHGGQLLTRAQLFDAIAAGAKEVEVEGTWVADGNILTATKVKIEDGDENDNHEAEARGVPNTIDPIAHTFRIQLTQWEGFSSSVGTQVNIEIKAGAHFSGLNGEGLDQDPFFAALATAPGVSVEGVYENGTITAWKLRLRDGSGGGNNGGHAEGRGTVSGANFDARTFDVTLVEWAGFGGSAGLVVHVHMADGATYRGFDGQTIGADGFFNKLTNNQLVEVEGSYNADTQTLTATRAKLED